MVTDLFYQMLDNDEVRTLFDIESKEGEAQMLSLRIVHRD